MNDPLLSLLAENRFFAGLTPAEIEDMRAAGTVRRFESGDLIVRQGDPADAFYLIFCGYAKLTQVTPDGHRVLSRFVPPGRGFGLTSILNGYEYVWSAYAVSLCRTWVLHGEKIVQYMERIPKLGINVMSVMVRANRESDRRYQGLLTASVEQRIASALVALSEEVGRETSEGILIDVPLSREDLAEYAGTTLYSVSRVLNRWEADGHVRTGRERVVVCQRDALHEISLHSS